MHYNESNITFVPIGATHITEDNAAEHWLADDQVSNMGTGDVGMDGGRNEVMQKQTRGFELISPKNKMI